METPNTMIDARFPRRGMRRFMDKLRGINYVTRWNFHSRIHDQNVASHTGWVCIFTLLLLELDHNDNAQVRADALAGATCHDWEEAVSGDGPFLVKKIMGRNEWEQRVVQFAVNELTGDVPPVLRGRLQRFCIGAKDGEAGRYVRAADLFDVLQYCQSEEFHGNAKMYRRIGREAVWLLRGMRWPAVDHLLRAMGVAGDKGMPVTDHMTHLGVDEATFAGKYQ